jgi:TldD protein
VKDLINRALNTAQTRGAQYADARVVNTDRQAITVRNGKVEAVSLCQTEGIGVRVLVDGAWGFASTNELGPGKVDETTAQAIEIARASATVKKDDVVLAPEDVHIDRYATPRQIDPFAVSIEDKVNLLLTADAAMRQVKGIAITRGSMIGLRIRKTFGNSQGSYIEQDLMETGAGIEAYAVGHDDVQKRSFPNSFGRQSGTGGYEHVQAVDLIGNAPRIAEEAVQLLTAKPCPAGTTTIIIDPTQLALQVHESCGHPIELDRVFGFEASFAGTSFLTTEKLGRFRYGSDLVNIVADATIPGGLGTFAYDDEGVPAQRVPIIKNGIFVGYLTSRETAAVLGQRSMGAARADGWNRIPIIRMTNINLEPGTWELDDLIADTDDGIFLQTNKSWSIDDRRLNFQFGTEIAWEIKGGKRGQMLKNATYTGITPQFWGSCDAICNDKYWQVWGTDNCGKGQPLQTAHVGHGCAPARFRNIRVGVMK